MRIGHWDITFLFSLICSLLINSGMVGVVVLRAQPPKIIDLNRWHTREVAPPPPPAQIIPPPPQKEVEFDNREAFGEHQGTGNALNSSPGDQPLVSMKADEVQAFLGRNAPAGGGGGGGASGGGGAPVMIGAAGPQQPAPRVRATAQPQPQPKPQAVAINQIIGSGDEPAAAKPVTAKPSPANPATAEPDAAKPAEAAPAPKPPAQATAASAVTAVQAPPGQPSAPGPPGPRNPAAADPTPPSDKDSDPFSDQNAFRFVNGRVDARNGRWVKTVKPHITDAGMVAAEMMSRVAVTFLATVDEEGNVIHVDRYHSSGSDYIDLPCEEALNQWKIEPSKDRSGKPVKDIVSITFVLY